MVDGAAYVERERAIQAFGPAPVPPAAPAMSGREA